MHEKEEVRPEEKLKELAQETAKKLAELLGRRKKK